MNDHMRRTAALALLPLLLVSCKPAKDKDGGGKGRTSRYAAVVAARAPFLDSRGGIASVSAADQVDLRAEIAGKVAEIAVRDGADVRRGALLVRLDDADARAQRDRAAAKARLATAALGRLREQVRVEAASAQQLETAQADSAVAAADLALAEVALERTRIRAPFDGTIGIVATSRGQWVSAGQKFATLVSRAGVRLDWAMPEGEVARVARGTSILWNVPASNRGGRAEVAALEPALDEATRTRTARALCRSGCEALLPGMAVEVRLKPDSTPVLSVLSQALTGDARGAALFVYRAGKAELVPVAPGRRSAEAIEILSGIAAGDTVLLPGASPPKPGAKVEIARVLGAPRAESGRNPSNSRGEAAGARAP